MANENDELTVGETEVPTPIPPGLYNAKFSGYEVRNDGSYGKYVILEFTVTDGEYTGTKRTLVASFKLTKNKNAEKSSKLFRTLTGLTGKEPQKSETVRLQDLVETECQILVENRPGETEGWQDVTKVLPKK